MSILDWFRGEKEEVAKAEDAPKAIARKSLFGTHAGDIESSRNIKDFVSDKFSALKAQQPAFDPKVTGVAMDDSSNGYPSFKMYDAGNNSVSDAVVYWYASQGFIGAQLCGILAQNWLVNKACAMPGDDAIRKGYNVVSIDGEELDPEAAKIIKAYDRSMRLTWNMREFIRKGRIFGIRVAMFKVQSTDPEYYEKPFNIDGVTANSYKGIVQVDPYWCAPMLDGAAASQPDTLHFYEPTWWIINGKKVHRSHLIIFRHAEPVDVLKPQYIYGGVPLTQQIMERVYASERVANEAPQLAMSKRTTVWLTDMEAAMSNTEQAIGRLNYWAQMRDNYGIKLGDKEGDEFQQFDTSLADFDSLIMTQYQLVAAIAGVPATKLIGTTPKGFNSTGEYEEASYHELLESIQTHDLTPLAERHHQLVIKSFVEPQLKKKIDVETTLNWLPLDTPTAQELAQTNLAKAQVGAALIEVGAISTEEERQRVATDKTSGYNEIGIMENESPEGEELAEKDYLNAQDAWVENDHPRAENGQFGSGAGGAASIAPNAGKATAAISQPASAKAMANKVPKHLTAQKKNKHLEKSFNPTHLKQLSTESQKQLTKIYEKAAENKDYFDSTNASIAKELGGEAAVVDIKGSERAVEKVLNDYEGDVTKIKDLLRTTISIKSLKDTDKAIELIKAKYGEPVKLKNTLNPDAPSPSGYRDINMVFEVKGSYMEVQVNMKPMLTVKYGKGHELYEQIRNIEGTALKEKRSLTKAEFNKVTKLNAESKKLYDAAYSEMSNA